jgi:hypothetical protein
MTMTSVTQSRMFSLTSKLLGITTTWPNQADDSAHERASKQEAVEGSTIRVMTSPRRAAATEAELFVAGLLHSRNNRSYPEVISALADFIYSKELKKGAWVLDVGLFGSSLFVSEACQELESGKGILWEIDPARKDSDGLLSDLSRHEGAPLPSDRGRSSGGA